MQAEAFIQTHERTPLQYLPSRFRSRLHERFVRGERVGIVLADKTAGKATFDRRQLGAQAVILLISTIAVAVWVNTKPIVFADESFAYVDFARELQLGKPSRAAFFAISAFPGDPVGLSHN